MQQASYVHGAHDVPLIGETIGAFLDGVAQRYGDRPALVVAHQDVRWTYLTGNFTSGSTGSPPDCRNSA